MTATTTSPPTAPQVEIVTTEGLGDRSYLVHDGVEAVVVDPQRDIDRVEHLLADLDVTLRLVLETHVHNDYVSGAVALARSHGATVVQHADDEVAYERRGVVDGDRLEVGRMALTAIHTPGHTPTHLSWLLEDVEGGQVAVFTGGGLLFGTVGRTDLVSAARTRELTRAQHASAHRLAGELDDDVAVLPTHGFGSFCSSISPEDEEGETVTESTIGRERRENVALTITDEEEFVESLLAGLDDHPRYYAHMAPINRLGPEPIDLSPPVAAEPAELRARIHADEWVVDLRSRTAYAGDHVDGTVNVGLDGSFVTYLAWLMPWNRPVTLVGDTADEVAEAQRELVRVGVDRPAAAATGGVDRFGDGLDRSGYRIATFGELAEAMRNGHGVTVVDTRLQSEFDEAHVAGALHIPLHELPGRVGEVPVEHEAWVHCGSGYRASIAASLLARAGCTPVLVDDEFGDAEDAGVALDRA